MIKRILLPTDLSPVSLGALEYAIDLAQPSQAEIVIVFAIEPVHYDVPELQIKERKREVQEKLDRVSAKVARRYPNCRTEVRFGIAHRVIVQMARKDNDDVIVMSMHGTSAVHDLLIGNVVERVVRSATCPVVLIPPPKRMKRKD